MLINTQYRSTEEEIMDSFDLQGTALKKTLQDLAAINSWLGGTSITVDGVLSVITSRPKQASYTIVDMGCGDGHMLRVLATLGKERGYSFKLIGIDGNAHTIRIAKELSYDYPEIEWYAQDFLTTPDAKENAYDIILCTLTLHHFKKPELLHLTNQFIAIAKMGVVINDLHRSGTAYYLFKFLCVFFIKNPIAQKDGAISILRGFKRSDLEQYAKQINGAYHRIRWRWAFRYQWILMKK
ncbi:methyltransferase domain-containing protein [Aquimarina sp. 2-A2]|uniref:methyltransferase domain-containing protein n=1 Tax=Aquimarina sp. 2-A2 TaxID=3382644 RepID=UPI00387F0239